MVVILVWLIVSACIFAASSTDAQRPAKIPRNGYLSPLTASSDAPRRAGFQQGLRELGYFDGQNIAIEYRLPTATLIAWLSWPRN